MKKDKSDAEEEDIENTGSDGNDDEPSEDADAIEEGTFEDEKVAVSDSDDDDDDEEETPADKGTWPADCYSFIAIHHPMEEPRFFFFGLLVWSFQIAFLILLVLRVASPKLSTNEDTDNPDEGFFSAFIPSNVSNLSRATQFMALLSYCIFADESLKDVVTAVELWPKLCKAKPGDRVPFIMLSCVLRFSQGILATIVVLLLVITTADVIDIILNFTAVNFISGFDDVAFELAQWGKYGPALEKEANRIEELPAPACIYRKYQHVRYLFTVIPIAFVLLIMASFVTASQMSTKIWITERLRVQFKDDSLYEVYSGCYDVTPESSRNRFIDSRVEYQNFEAKSINTRFGYCQDERQWFLYSGNESDACVVDELDKVAYSDKTYAFDISTVFEESWYSRSGTPLELYFFENGNDLTDKECSAFLGDGVCNEAFNKIDYDFDSGDCCVATCDEIKCGVGTVSKAFNTNVTTGNGYQRCRNLDMVPITIYLNDVYLRESILEDNLKEGPFSDVPPRDPLMVLDCDGRNVLMVEIDSAMKGQSETVLVADGATCDMLVKNDTSGPLDIWYVDYTIYHGDEESIEKDPIVIATGNSFQEEITLFQRIQECFFSKLDKFIDRATIYTGTEAANYAIDWLMNDTQGYSNCEIDGFVERFALATVNFAAPIADEDDSNSVLWINDERHCVWRTVACVNGSVTELDLGAGSNIVISGTIPTEIALLQKLTRFDVSANDLTGTIPSALAQLENLVYFGAATNNFTGTLPSELTQLTNLKWLFLETNAFTGTIPDFFAEMPQMRGIIMYGNEMNGSVPDSIGLVKSLEYLIFADNLLTGTIPSVIADLRKMKYISLSYNSLIGTIPSELGVLTDLDNIEVEFNALTGSIPAELLNKTFVNFDVYGNLLSDLIPVPGDEICTAEGGEHYCNCDVDCTFNKNRCQCEEAQACCSAFFQQFTPCTICDNDELDNPNFFVDEVTATCADIASFVKLSLLEYGNPNTCDVGKDYFRRFGCFCAEQAEQESTVTPANVTAEGIDKNASAIVV